MSIELNPTLVPSFQRKDALPSLNEFQTAVNRLKGNEHYQSQSPHRALQLYRASTVLARARDVAQHLAEHEVWTLNMATSESRDPIVTALGQEMGVSKSTMLARIRSNGAVVNDILQRLNPEDPPWSVVILLLVFIEPLIKGKRTKGAIDEFVQRLLGSQDHPDWQNPSFARSLLSSRKLPNSHDVLEVIQIACGGQPPPRRPRVILTGGLRPLSLGTDNEPSLRSPSSNELTKNEMSDL